ATLDAGAGADLVGDAREVGVERGALGLRVADADVAAVARARAGELHDAVAGGVDGRARRNGGVDAGVHLVDAVDRVEARAEAAGEGAGYREDGGHLRDGLGALPGEPEEFVVAGALEGEL